MFFIFGLMKDKLKVYLDTTIFSFLQALDSPEKMADTLIFWEDLMAMKYQVFTSDVAIREINKCHEPKRSFMLDKLKELSPTVLETETNVEELAMEFVKLGILKEKSIDDCQHIATALLEKCNIIVSWNFQHIVNYKTIEGVQIISVTRGFDHIDIFCPSSLIGGNDD